MKKYSVIKKWLGSIETIGTFETLPAAVDALQAAITARENEPEHVKRYLHFAICEGFKEVIKC